MATLRTVRTPVGVELERVRGSRFVADLAPVVDEAAARALVDEVRVQHPDATHHCWALRLADGTERGSDDGEPRDTAGAPILRHLQGADLADVVCVVTRWFGGTKLGRGGLIRAYGASAEAAIAAATVVERPILARVAVEHDYDLSAPVQAVLAAHGADVVDEDYGTRVALLVAIPIEDVDTFVRAVVDATAGRVRPSSVP